MAENIALIDYGAGNLRSVHNALKAAGAANIHVTDDPKLIAAADRIILPGVGAFGACRKALMAVPDMVDIMTERVQRDAVPFLGICVGMQLLADKGVEFGHHDGLGWIGGVVGPIEREDSAIKIPHMGWNDVDVHRPHAVLDAGEAYYLHGYHFQVENRDDILATTDHGGPLVAAVGRNNIIGVQFHPEKSQAYGLAFLRRFLEWKA